MYLRNHWYKHLIKIIAILIKKFEGNEQFYIAYKALRELINQLQPTNSNQQTNQPTNQPTN